MLSTTKNAIQELRTIRDMLRWTVSQFNDANLFYGHGTDNAWDEAAFLILSALHLPPTVDNRILDARLLLVERETIVELVKQRIYDHTPAPYLTHEAWFAGLPFYVDERVIIPRSPVAELIEQGFSPWLEQDNVYHVLDLCTGSGCIAVACAFAFPQAEVIATDISKDALAVAKINVEKHQLNQQVQLIQSDLFAKLPAKQFDLIISNPPYVDANDMAALPAEFTHEPTLALAAGEDGLDIVKQILLHASEYLSPHGILVVEVGNSAHALEEQFPEIPFMWLEFERGGQGVFLLTAEQVKHVRQYIR